MNRHTAFTLGLLAVFWLGIVSVAQAATVRAYVQPDQARPNQVVTYVITVQDGSVERLSELRLPLQIQQTTNVSTSQQFSITNGRQTSSIRLSWGLMASEPGDFIIPAQNIKVNGQMVATNEVKLTVGQGGAGQDALADADDTNKPILQLELGKKEIYQGEVMPLNCTLYIPRQTSLRRLGLIEIEKSDFAIARFPQQSDQTTTVIGDVGYTVLTFRSTLSSLRTGDLKVGPATMEILVEVPVEGNPRQNMFPPGFPQGFFGVASEPRKLVVKSQPVTLKVLPLPEEGRPENFSGAVGDFVLSASASPTELTVGDPVAVEMVVEGIGNFDALTPPALTAPSGWKSYPAKRYSIEGQLDQSQVPTLDRKIGYSQVFIPEAVHDTLPPFEINFFSSSKKQYVTLRTEAIPLDMKPAPAVSTSEVTPGSVGESVPPPLVPDPQPEITDIIVNPPATPRWLPPTGTLLLRSTTYWTVQAIPAGLLLLASFLAVLGRRRRARMAGRAGELRAAWSALDERALADAEFLRRAAQFIHTAKSGDTVLEPELKSILDRYQSSNFTAFAAAPVTPEERRQITHTLGGLFSRALAKVTPLILIAFMISGSLHAQAPSPDAVYQEALAELEKGNFARAQYHAESLTKKDPPQLSSEVFQIIGHARYRQEDFGRAVLWYERARLFDPRSPELRQNLRHLYEKLRFVSFQAESPLSQWSLWLSLNEWVILATIGFWLFLLPLAWRLLAGRRSLPWALTVSVIGLLIALPASALASIRPLGPDRVRDISVVTVPELSAYTAATVTSGTVMDLPAGSQVRILEKRGAWNYVEIPNRPENLRGWVESAAITPLWIWDAQLVP
ncbi:BatD family protein [Prosthecobacter sp. SYSU 5D2]